MAALSLGWKEGVIWPQQMVASVLFAIIRSEMIRWKQVHI